MLPMHQVAANSMAPAHMTPSVAERIVLIEEVVLSLVVHQSVRIIHPILFRREMELRTEWFRIVARRIWRSRCKCCTQAKSQDNAKPPAAPDCPKPSKELSSCR